MALIQSFNLKPRIGENGVNGLYIQGAGDATLARKVGVETGDVLLAVNGMRLNSLQKLEVLAERLEDTSRVFLLIERKGQQQTLTVQMNELMP